MIKQKVTLEQLPRLAFEIAQKLRKETSFVLFLKGDMGAGKTTFVRQFFYALGLSKEESVTSPTFTYLNEYHIHQSWYAHIDLYRTPGMDLSSELEYRDYRGIIVEWPSEGFEPEATHVLDIEVMKDNSRLFTMSL